MYFRIEVHSFSNNKINIGRSGQRNSFFENCIGKIGREEYKRNDRLKSTPLIRY